MYSKHICSILEQISSDVRRSIITPFEGCTCAFLNRTNTKGPYITVKLRTEKPQSRERKQIMQQPAPFHSIPENVGDGGGRGGKERLWWGGVRA